MLSEISFSHQISSFPLKACTGYTGIAATGGRGDLAPHLFAKVKFYLSPNYAGPHFKLLRLRLPPSQKLAPRPLFIIVSIIIIYNKKGLAGADVIGPL